MLENKDTQFKNDEIAAFKLATGEEVIGKVTSVTDKEVGIDKPCTLGMAQNGQMALSPACIMANMEKPVTYRLDHIMAKMVPNEELSNAYRQATGGITVPPQNLVIPQ